MSFEVPVEGGKGSSEDPKVKKAIEGLNKLVGSENKIKGAGVENETLEGKHLKEGSLESKQVKDGTLTDTDLASPNNAAYRTLLSAQNIIGGVGAGTYILGNDGIEPAASGGKLTTGSPKNVHLFYLDDADYTVAGKTQKLRLRVQIFVNGTKPTLKFTFGLYPISGCGGGANELTMTLGAVVAGSAVEINEPAANALAWGVGADFAVPADGAYALGVLTSGAMTANSAALLSAQLQSHSV